MYWKTVGVVDNENMNVPHVLQQRYVAVRDGFIPDGEHRLVSVNDLDGVKDD